MSDNKKICFISCVNNDVFYGECLKYIQNLIVPEGYTVETISIKDAKSMCEGYNAAMESSDAKYKVYLHQDTFIINKNFISDIVKLFNGNEKIGMLGVCGAETIPTSAIWWDSTHKYGKVYENHTGEMKILAFNENYHNVKTLDGLIMVTQHDLPWREDIFNGWHFYDISQCTEFILAGYEIVVPNQSAPWCIHDCGLVNTKNGYEEYRNVYLDEYSKRIFPLVSILIPTYNQTKYLKEALESAINQTYHNIEIIIGDDSTNDEVKKFIEPYLKKYSNLFYYKNERDKMDYGISNVQMLLGRSKGEYVNYLYHDDVFHNEKIERMMNCFINNQGVTLVTSVRQPIDDNGNKLSLTGAFSRLFEKDTVIKGRDMSKLAISNITNFIGEPTVVLFKREYMDKYGFFNGVQISIIDDLASWFNLLQYGNAVYLTKSLSYFRIHHDQNSNKPNVVAMGIIYWQKLIEESFNTGIIENNNEYKTILNKWIQAFIPILSKFIEDVNCVDNDVKLQLENSCGKVINEIMFRDIKYN